MKNINIPIKKTGPKSSIRVGQRFVTKSGWVGEVIEYHAHDNVVVQWEDGSKQRIRSKEVVTGSVKPLNQPSVEGIGYFGIGRFVPWSYKDGEKAPKELYGYWVRMFSRCYNPFELDKPRNRNYRDVTIDPLFHCFQRFAEWAIAHGHYKEGWQLDKDLLGDGKIYSPNSCTFLPAEINSFLSEKQTGGYQRGVNIIKPKAGTNARVGYIARVHTGIGREYLGFFKTSLEAHLAYKAAKEDYAKVLAEKYKDVLDSRAYTALANYEVHIDD